MWNTGVHATDEQLARIRAAQDSDLVIEGELHKHRPIKVTHACAIEAGLPEYGGFYGINLTTKEFLKT